MSRLTRDGTAETVSRDQILRRELNADREKFIFPVQLTTCRMGNLTRLIHTLVLCVTIHNVGDKPTVALYWCYRGGPWVFTVERAYDINKAEGSCQPMMKRAVRIIV